LLRLGAGGGGGGGGGDFGAVGQELAYKLSVPLSEGQEIQITALVTFNEYGGISDQVPFDLHLFVEQCP